MTVEFHASKVSMRAIGSLKPYEKNNRKHPPAQVSALAKIIADGGWTQPIVIDEDNVILSGHGRLLAAKELKLAKVPCVTATGLSEAQKRAMRISDNQSGLMGGADWDLDNLKFEIDALKIDDFDLDLTGFSLGDLAQAFLEQQEGRTDAREEWRGMPEFEQPNIESYKSLTLHFENEEQIQAFSKMIKQPVNKKTKFLWFKPQVTNDTESKRYT